MSSIVDGEHVYDPYFWIAIVATIALLILSVSWIVPVIENLVVRGVCG